MSTRPRRTSSCAVPDSGVPAALGYSRASGLPFVLGLVRNHYVGRTFIEPRQAIRHFGVKVKLNPVRSAVAGKRVVLVDDSIVRGTTSRKIVMMLKAAGAKEVHLRISSPPTTGPCFYGIDTPERRELIAASQSVEEIRAFVGADSLGYLSEEGMLSCLDDAGGELLHRVLLGQLPRAGRGRASRRRRQGASGELKTADQAVDVRARDGDCELPWLNRPEGAASPTRAPASRSTRRTGRSPR